MVTLNNPWLRSTTHDSTQQAMGQHQWLYDPLPSTVAADLLLHTCTYSRPSFTKKPDIIQCWQHS